MALRAKELRVSTRSLREGEALRVETKVENTGAQPGRVALSVTDLRTGAMRQPVEFTFVFEPAAVDVRPHARTAVTFTWKAALPAGVEAFTFRGRLQLTQTEGGKLVADEPLDVYVSRT